MSKRSKGLVRALLEEHSQLREVKATVQARRQAADRDWAIQEDANLATNACADLKVRPFPPLIATLIGTSLKTASEMLAVWFGEVVDKLHHVRSGTHRIGTDVDVTLHALAMRIVEVARTALRSGGPDPMQALLTAAEQGQHEALRMQSERLQAQLTEKEKQLAAMTFEVSHLSKQVNELSTQHVTRTQEQEQQIARVIDQVGQLNTRLSEALDPTAASNADLGERITQLSSQVEQLTTKVEQINRHARRRGPRQSQPPKAARTSKAARSTPARGRKPRARGGAQKTRSVRKRKARRRARR